MTRGGAQMTWRPWLTATLLSVTLAGCSILPSFGPSTDTIEGGALEVVSTVEEDVVPFRIVEVSAATLPQVQRSRHSFPTTFQNQRFRTTDETAQAGDRLEIRIWEVAEDGLFATAGNRETLLEVTVSNSGTVSVPYADTIIAEGLTPAQLRFLLLERYRGQAVEPEIAVAIADTQSRAATVLGAVRSPGRVAIPSRGIYLLDLLAQAGGVPEVPWEVTVTVQRAASTVSLPLSDILANPSNNVVIFPGDTINIAHTPRRFAVYGAVNQPGNIDIPLEDPTLAYLLAEAGGLNDRVAAAQSAFVFRPSAATHASEVHPAVAYRFDFSRPDSLLLAGMFTLQPTDIVYVASADAADFQRFVSTVLSPFFTAASRTTNFGG